MERRERRKREKREKKEEKRLRERERERERQTRVAGGSLSGAGFADDPVMYRATVFTIPVFVTLLPLLPRLGCVTTRIPPLQCPEYRNQYLFQCL